MIRRVVIPIVLTVRDCRRMTSAGRCAADDGDGRAGGRRLSRGHGLRLRRDRRHCLRWNRLALSVLRPSPALAV